MTKIFISYARTDGSEIADELADRLRALDHEVFLDTHSLTGGTHWQPELGRRVKWAELVVVLITEASNNSDHVYQEVDQAARQGKVILPVQINETPLPVHLRGTWQAVKFQDDNYESVLLEIERTIRKLPKPGLISQRGRIFFVIGIVIGVLLLAAFLLISSLNNDDQDQSTKPGTTSLPTESAALPTNSLTPTITKTSTLGPTSIPTASPTVTLTRTPRPTNTPRPTSTPILPGSMLLEEDFEDNSYAGLMVSHQDGFWQITRTENENLVYEAQAADDWISLSFGSSSWQNYTIEYRVKLMDYTGDYPVISCIFRAIGEDYYVQSFTPNYNLIGLSIVRNGSSWHEISSNTYRIERNVWQQVRIEVVGNHIQIFVDGTSFIDFISSEYTVGGLSLMVSPHAHVQFDDIRVTAR